MVTMVPLVLGFSESKYRPRDETLFLFFFFRLIPLLALLNVMYLGVGSDQLFYFPQSFTMHLINSSLGLSQIDAVALTSLLKLQMIYFYLLYVIN